MNNMSSYFLKRKKLFVERSYYPYKISLIYQNSLSLEISIKKDDFIYESEFNMENLNKKGLINMKKNRFQNKEDIMEDIIKFISILIDNNKVKIEEKYSKLFLKFPNRNEIEVFFELKLKNKNEIFKNLIKDVRFLKYNNIKRLNNNICTYYHYFLFFILFIVLIFILFLYVKQSKEIIKKNKIIEEYKINFEKIEDKIKKIEEIQIQSFNLKKINEIKIYNDKVHHLTKFPSGILISVTYNTFNIYDQNFNIKQNFKKPYNTSVSSIYIKDENNFITCYYDNSIRTWIKKKDKFDVNKIILNAHDSFIYKVIFSSNGNLISCSEDKTVKIWEENNYGYKNIITLNHSDRVYSILLLEDKNILISTGHEGTKFWNITNYKLIIHFEEAKCIFENGLKRINDDKIIVSGFIISISKQLIIKQINNLFWGKEIYVIEDKGVFLVGENINLKIYRSDNYELIQNITNTYENEINGLIQLNNHTIVSYSKSGKVQVWIY